MMAWREVRTKCMPVSIKKIFTTTVCRHAIPLSASTLVSIEKSNTYARYYPECSISIMQADGSDFRTLTTQCAIRCFHGSREALAKQNLEPMSKKKRPRGKFPKGAKNTKAPVDAQDVSPRPKIVPPRSKTAPPKPKLAAKSLAHRTIDIFEGITIAELSKHTSQSTSTLQSIVENAGEKVQSEFDPISIDIAELVLMELGANVRRLYSLEGAKVFPRPPVVTVMGHVDHGKTSLLDALRQTSVAAKEAGGITQHIGAFVVRMPSGAAITFLDTPGHAAFSAMRARGAAITDIVVLVVAADDGVMPQTREAMAHAKAADVPMVVAINKCDKPNADPERVKLQLASEGVAMEEMGGDVQVVRISAIAKTGLDALEEALLLQAELMDLKARVDGPAQAYVVEARLDKGRGPLATAIVRAGTLQRGQYVVVGTEWGKIRGIRDTVRKLTEQATPAMPVELEGLKGVPMAGDEIVVVVSEERAKMLSEGRKDKFRLDRLGMMMNGERSGAPEGEAAERIELPILVKADVQGSVEAVTESLKALNSPQVFVNVFHVGVGPLSQSDLDLALSCDACMVGFNIPSPSGSLSAAASRAGIKIKLHRVIYHLLEDVGNLVVEKAPGMVETQVAGEAEVLSVFVAMSKGKAKGVPLKIAGCRVRDGRFKKSSTLRLLRSGEAVFEGPCASLKQGKNDAEAVGKGNECGLVIGDCDDYRAGDVIHCLEEVRRKPRFVSEGGLVRIDF